jgi:hypothetical protein
MSNENIGQSRNNQQHFATIDAPTQNVLNLDEHQDQMGNTGFQTLNSSRRV